MLDRFFKPKSVAVIGASREKKKLGRAVLDNILDYGFKGNVYPINPKAKKIKGLKCYPSVLEVSNPIDLAVIVVPAQVVPEVLEECGKKGTRDVIIISAGFGEIGKKGELLEEEIAKISIKYRIRILGPNCLGIISRGTKLNATFSGSVTDEPSNIAVMSQSGAMGSAILDWAKLSKVDFDYFVSLGNKTDISEIDFLEYWADDPKIRVILAYLENISDGGRFIEVAKRVTKKKPVIILKTGTTKEGKKAVSSHTGNLAGKEEVIEAAFTQSGVIRAKTTEDLFDFPAVFSYLPYPKDEKVAIITNAGGPAVAATDAVGKSRVLKLAKLSPNTERELKRGLPESASLDNPIDLIGDAQSDRFKLATQAVLNDPEVSSLVVLLTPQVMTEVEKTAKIISDFKKKTKKPIITSFMGGVLVEKGIEVLEKNRVPVFDYPERAIYALQALVKYSQYLSERKVSPFDLKINREKAKEIFSEINKNNFIDSKEASKLLNFYGIPTINSWIVDSSEKAVEAACELGFPVALKIVSPKILHKTEVGGVKLNLYNSNQVRNGYKEIIRNVIRNIPKPNLRGIAVYPMIEGQQEVIIGAKRDPNFGHVIMFGLGGVFVELLKDVSFRICPITFKDAYDMIKEIKGYKLLFGFRDIEPLDIDEIASCLVRLSQLVCDLPEISELDINPLKVKEKGKGVLALDVKIVIG